MHMETWQIFMEKKRVVVIGGGASGLMASIAAAQNGAVVTVLEQNEKPGKKICATGNGKCNFTNLQMQKDALVSLGACGKLWWWVLRRSPLVP